MKMMKINKIYLLISLVVLSAGCSDDFLDRQPLDTINTENYPANGEELVTLVNGAYQPMQRPKLYNLRMWTTDIIAGNSAKQTQLRLGFLLPEIW